MNRFFLVAVGVVGLAGATPAVATTYVLDFDPAVACDLLTLVTTCANDTVLGPDYGDIPGVLDISWFEAAQHGGPPSGGEVAYRFSRYGDLLDVAYSKNDVAFGARFALLDPNATITFNSVDYAKRNITNNDPASTRLSLISLSGTGVLTTSGSVTAPAIGHATWSPFGSAPIGGGFFFHFGNAFSDSGIDNLTFTINQPSQVPVPEPATWAMMIIGFGFVGAAMRRGKKLRLASA